MTLPHTGPWNYNRFAQIEEHYARERAYFTEKAKEKKSKPDFLDMDKDGDTDEPMKKAIKEKGGKGDKDDKKEVKESSCGSSCKCKKCEKKKDMTEWIHSLVREGYDLSEYDMNDMEDLYDKKLQEDVEEVSLEDAIIEYLVENGFANNWVSAEIVMKNMSEQWLENVVNQMGK